MKRLVCVVEGKGEVAAVPNLCVRVLRHLAVAGWTVDPEPVRQPRGRLVDEKAKSPGRPCLVDGVRRAAALARARPADAALFLCDSDDDCPAIWGPSAERAIREILPGAAVMSVHEYEAWLLLSYTGEERAAAHVRAPERVRDAKGELRKLVPGYLPTHHQLELTRRINVALLRERSESFDKLVRALARLCGPV